VRPERALCCAPENGSAPRLRLSSPRMPWRPDELQAVVVPRRRPSVRAHRRSADRRSTAGWSYGAGCQAQTPPAVPGLGPSPPAGCRQASTWSGGSSAKLRRAWSISSSTRQPATGMRSAASGRRLTHSGCEPSIPSSSPTIFGRAEASAGTAAGSCPELSRRVRPAGTTYELTTTWSTSPCAARSNRAQRWRWFTTTMALRLAGACQGIGGIVGFRQG
jgi:hypothetical protein